MKVKLIYNQDFKNPEHKSVISNPDKIISNALELLRFHTTYSSWASAKVEDLADKILEQYQAIVDQLLIVVKASESSFLEGRLTQQIEQHFENLFQQGQIFMVGDKCRFAGLLKISFNNYESYCELEFLPYFKSVTVDYDNPKSPNYDLKASKLKMIEFDSPIYVVDKQLLFLSPQTELGEYKHQEYFDDGRWVYSTTGIRNYHHLGFRIMLLVKNIFIDTYIDSIVV